jgi:hypothetical protein
MRNTSSSVTAGEQRGRFLKQYFGKIILKTDFLKVNFEISLLKNSSTTKKLSRVVPPRPPPIARCYGLCTTRLLPSLSLRSPPFPSRSPPFLSRSPPLSPHHPSLLSPALGGLRGMRGTAACGTTDVGPPRRVELLVRGSCRHRGGVAVRHGTGKQWRRGRGEGGGCGCGGPIRRREPAASTRVGRSGGECTGGFVGKRAHGRISAASAQAAAAMLSVPGSTSRVGVGKEQLPAIFFIFYLICRGGSRRPCKQHL